MFCQKCGNQLNNDSIFCDKCGNKISQSAEITNNKDMKKCKSCGNLISKKADICIHCGRDDRPIGSKSPAIGCLGVVLAIIGFLLIFSGSFNIIR